MLAHIAITELGGISTDDMSSTMPCIRGFYDNMRPHVGVLVIATEEPPHLVSLHLTTVPGILHESYGDLTFALHAGACLLLAWDMVCLNHCFPLGLPV